MFDFKPFGKEGIFESVLFEAPRKALPIRHYKVVGGYWDGGIFSLGFEGDEPDTLSFDENGCISIGIITGEDGIPKTTTIDYGSLTKDANGDEKPYACSYVRKGDEFVLNEDRKSVV